MKYYLLIDTNIFYNLISDTEYSSALKRLEFLVRNEHIALLRPTVLLTEWIKHKKAQTDKINDEIKKLKKKAKQKKTAGNPVADLDEENIINLKAVLISQVMALDDLLNYNTIPIAATAEITDLINKRQAAKKAPFHRQGDHINDAYIFYSAVEYLRAHDIDRLFFVSNNIKQFAEKGKSPVQLHHDLVDYAANIGIDYTTTIGDTFAIFDELDLPRVGVPNFSDLRKIHRIFAVDKSKPVVHQILEYLKKRLDGWEFVPKQILNEHYPFILSEYFDYYHRPFTIVTDNNEVFKILKETCIENGVIKTFPTVSDQDEATAKALLEIFEILHSHLFYRVSFKFDKEIDFQHTGHNDTRPFLLRTFRKFDFRSLIKVLPEQTRFDSKESISDNIKTAYAYYKMGNYKNAAILFNAIRKKTEKKKEPFYYIACFNAKKLAKIVKNSYALDASINSILQDSDSLDLNRAKNDCISAKYENRSLVEYIHNISFIKDEFPDLHETHNEIRSLMRGQNSGVSQTTERLLETYFSTEEFLSNNCIVYDIFSEFRSVAHIFVDGMIMSFMSNPHLNGKLRYFSDGILAQFILHCKSEKLLEYLDMHSLKDAEYQHEISEDAIFEMMTNLLSQVEALNTPESGINDDSTPYFWETYGSYIERCLIIYSYCKFPKEQIEAISEQLVHFVNNPGQIYLRRYSLGIHKFLSTNKLLLPETTIQKFFASGIRQKALHNERYFEVLADVCKSRDIKISLGVDDLAAFNENFFGTCPLCNTKHAWHFVGDIYTVLSQQPLKQQIKNIVEERLLTQFDPGDYYLAALYDILTPSNDFDQKYAAAIESILDLGKKPRYAGLSTFYFDPRLDDYINFRFRYDKDLPAWFTEKAPQLSTYYDWICHLDDFDYSNFDPTWLNHHFTSLFKRKFRTSKKLREALIKAVRENPTSSLGFKFIIIFESID